MRVRQTRWRGERAGEMRRLESCCVQTRGQPGTLNDNAKAANSKAHPKHIRLFTAGTDDSLSMVRCVLRVFDAM